MSQLAINAVERETGLNKDLLRMWERRYGFPAPTRDAKGERLYPLEQVARLLVLRRLLDQGHRPGRLMKLSDAELSALAIPIANSSAVIPPKEVYVELIHLLRSHDVQAIQQHLYHQQTQQSLRAFIGEYLSEANRVVGDAWKQGQISIAEEHLYTEQVHRLLRQVMQNLPLGQQAPRCLLTTVSGELHSLGLLMVETILRLSGCDPVNLGPNLPLLEIAAAAKAHKSDLVILSYSSAYPTNEINKTIIDLRKLLLPEQVLWCGGSGVRMLRKKPEGVVITTEMEDFEAALLAWRARRSE